MSKQTNNGKTVYIREDLAFKTIRDTNLGVIEADEFRKNLDPIPDASFDLDFEIAKIDNYINKSSVKSVVNLAEKSLKEKFAKELLNYISRISKPLKHIRPFIKKYCLHCKYEKPTIKNKANKNLKTIWSNVLFWV